MLVRRCLPFVALLAAACQDATPRPGETRAARDAAPTAPVTAEPPAADHGLPGHAQGTFDRASAAVESLIRGTAGEPLRPCGVIRAALAHADLQASQDEEVRRVLAQGGRLCARDAWVVAAVQSLSRGAGGCDAARQYLARIEPPHRDAEVEKLDARIASECAPAGK